MADTRARSQLVHRSAFAEPLYRRYFPAACFSTLASWLIRFLFGWTAWELTHSAFWVGVVAGAMLLPTFLFSPLFGIVSDRINPRNGLLVTVLAHGLVAALAGLADALGLLTLPALVALGVLLGAATSAHTPIRLALIPLLVQRAALPSAIGYSAMIFNTSRIIGPALGAWLVAVFSLAAGFLVATCLCLASMPPLLGIRGVREVQGDKTASFFAALRAGFSYALSHRAIRLVLGLTLLNGALGRTLLELLPAFSGQLLDGRAETLATLSATAGAGSILGGLFVSRLGGGQRRIVQLVLLCLAVAAGCLFAVQWLAGALQFCVLVFVLSMMTTVAGTGSQALAQLIVDEAYRGRVLSLWTMLAMGTPAIGAVAVGALAQYWGFPLVAAATATFALVGLVLLRNRIRRGMFTAD
jgi:MFS family permease